MCVTESGVVVVFVVNLSLLHLRATDRTQRGREGGREAKEREGGKERRRQRDDQCEGDRAADMRGGRVTEGKE